MSCLQWCVAPYTCEKKECFGCSECNTGDWMPSTRCQAWCRAPYNCHQEDDCGGCKDCSQPRVGTTTFGASGLYLGDAEERAMIQQMKQRHQANDHLHVEVSA